MPYVKGGGAQKDSGLPAVQDVFYSENVYANNVQVALWQKPGQSAAFANDVPAPDIAFADLNQQSVAQASARSPQQIPNAAVSNNMVEQGYIGTPVAPVSDSTGTGGAVATGAITPTTGSGLILPDPVPSGNPQDLATWLGQRASEGRRGMWNRVSPPAPAPAINPGNDNIIGIWKSIGLKAYTNNDQTAWCMGFVNFALKQCGYKWCPEASSWAIRSNPGRWGATSVPLNQGQPGDIALFSFGHVAFVYKANNGVYTFVGGNQGGGKNTSGGAPNNPVKSCVSESWATGCGPGSYASASLIGLWRPSKA
jgi:hypothetical protein